jgi:hypothetical protein
LVPANGSAGAGREALLKFYAGIDSVSNHVVELVMAQQIAPNVIVSMSHWSADLKDETGKINHIQTKKSATNGRSRC